MTFSMRSAMRSYSPGANASGRKPGPSRSHTRTMRSRTSAGAFTAA